MKKEVIETLVKTGILRKKEIDSARIKSEIDAAINTADVVKNMAIDENNSTLAFREIYESIRQLGDAKWWSLGYEPQNHDITLTILKEIDITHKVKLNFLERYKNIRHNANYRGEKVSVSNAKEIIEFWDMCSEEIINDILNKPKSAKANLKGGINKITILGLGAAGFGAALAAKKQDRSSEITIIDEKDFDLLHQCGLPFALEGKIKDFSNLKHSINADKMGMKLIKSKIKSIDFDKKLINGKIEYDKLIIALGSTPFIPPIKTNNKIFTVHNLNDTKELEKNIKKNNKAIIIGAGAIGLETAIALNKKGMKVEVIDMLPSCFPKAIDKDISEILEEKLKKKGIKLELDKKISEIKEKALVVMATGVKPNTDFIDIKKIKGAIEVNDKMETSIKDVYAIGDCTINPYKLATAAYRQGVIAGTNAANGNLKYSGSLGTFVSIIDYIEIAATGLNSFFAEQNKIKPIIGKAKGKNRPEWYGKAKELTVKIIADEKGKLIGGQAIGEGAKERVNIIAAAIKGNLKLKDVAELELAYCPAVSDYYDVLNLAAELGLRKIK